MTNWKHSSLIRAKEKSHLTGTRQEINWACALKHCARNVVFHTIDFVTTYEKRILFQSFAQVLKGILELMLPEDAGHVEVRHMVSHRFCLRLCFLGLVTLSLCSVVFIMTRGKHCSFLKFLFSYFTFYRLGIGGWSAPCAELKWSLIRHLLKRSVSYLNYSNLRLRARDKARKYR